MAKATETLIPIHEQFYTFQGEGMHAGRAAYFIRSHGCPLHCPWCDSAGTWHKDWKPHSTPRMGAHELVDRVLSTRTEIVVITGGEPAIWDWSEFTDLLCERTSGMVEVHIETSGSYPLKGEFDWITVSPKWSNTPLLENLMLATEIKLIVEDSDSIQKWWDKLDEITDENYFEFCIDNSKTIRLHPEWTQRNSSLVLNTITEAVKDHPKLMRAGWQMHKLYSADSLDPGAAELVPLGGCVENGY